MKKTYQQKEHMVAEWHNKQMEYWEKYNGYLRDHEDHWEDCFHSKTEYDWEDFVEVTEVLRIQHPDEWRRYYNLPHDIKEIQKRVMLGKPVVRPYAKNEYNKIPFRAWMAFKDFLNDVAGTPTPKYEPPKVISFEQSKKEQSLQKKIDIFGNLFEIELPEDKKKKDSK